MNSLSTIRELKEHGTEVYFEKENIWTFDSKGELLLTIMSSLAQEESRSISENVRWGQRKKISDGKFNLNYSTSWAMTRDPMAVWSSTRRRRKSSAGFTATSSQGCCLTPSPRS